MSCDRARPVAHVVAELGVSRATGYKWLDRYRAEGPAGLLDRSEPGAPVPASHQRRSRDRGGAAAPTAQARPGPDRAAGRLPASTVHAVLTRRGLSRLAWMDRPTGQVVRRYERDRPGELVHVDVKKLGRLRDGGGWRVHGRDSPDTAAPARPAGRVRLRPRRDRRPHPPGLRRDPPRRTADTCAGFLRRAAGLLRRRTASTIERVMTDNALAYRRRGLWPPTPTTSAQPRLLHQRRYRPQTNCEGVITSAPGTGLTPQPTGPPVPCSRSVDRSLGGRVRAAGPGSMT